MHLPVLSFLWILLVPTYSIMESNYTLCTVLYYYTGTIDLCAVKYIGGAKHYSQIFSYASTLWYTTSSLFLSLSYRKMDHLNLCKFIGAIVKDPNNLAIISEYCPKGSLNDVLQNEDIPLNWGFRFSFATDIARGMTYLHSKRVYHGRLTSSNCVIDDRWVVKISGGWSTCALTDKWAHLCSVEGCLVKF